MRRMAEAATGETRAASRQTVGELPGAREVFARASGENFSVASLVLGSENRRHLLAIYGYARLVDQIGDASRATASPLLELFEADSSGSSPGSSPSIRCCGGSRPRCRAPPPRGPFQRLIEANRRDQLQTGYATFAELVDYCDLSANPVGELVLHVFGSATPDRVALSDKVCTALQLAEHWQDVAEDYAAGRVYLPAEDLARFGVARATSAPRLPSACVADRVRGRSRPRPARPRRSARRARCAGAPGSPSPVTSAAAGRRSRRSRPPATTCSPAPSATRSCGGHAGDLRPTCGGLSGDRDRSCLRALPRGSRGSPTRASTPGCGCCRPSGAPRSSPSTRSRAGSTTSPTASSTRRAKLAALGASTRRARALDQPTTRCSSHSRTRRAASRSRSRPSRTCSTAPSMDARGAAYETFAELERYCRRVAGSIGRLSLGVFDCSDRERGAGSPTTSASRSRSATSCATSARTPRTGASTCRARTSSGSAARRAGGFSGPIELVIAFEAERGLGWLRRGLELVPLLDRRSASCVLAMAGKYRRLLERIASDPRSCCSGRLSLRAVGEGARARARSLARAGA